MLYNMYNFLLDFDNLRKNVLDSHNYSVQLGLFLDQIILLVTVLDLLISHPPFVEGIVVVEDTGLIDIAVEDIVVVDTAQAETEAMLIQLALVTNSSLGRYSSFSLGATEVLCNPFHHVLPIYKIYNTD